MRPPDHMDSFEVCDRFHQHRRLPAHLRSTRCYGGSASSQANPKTNTTSGAASPITSGSGSSATSGSIALGAGAKYQESGSIDLTGANLQTVGGSVVASGGSTVNVGDQALDSAIGQVINSLSSGGSIPVSLAGGNDLGTDVIPITTSTTAPATSTTSLLDGINWTLVIIIGVVATAAVGIFLLIGGRK